MCIYRRFLPISDVFSVVLRLYPKLVTSAGPISKIPVFSQAIIEVTFLTSGVAENIVLYLTCAVLQINNF